MIKDIEKATEIFLEFKEQLASYLYRLTANSEDVKDIIQDTLLKVIENIDSFNGKSTYKTWVFSIATNLAKDNLRAKNRWSLDAQDKCKSAAIESTYFQQLMKDTYKKQEIDSFDIKEHIDYCFTCISKNLKLEIQIAIVLKEIYNFKRKEIADILNKSEGVIKHMLFDGRKELQEKFDNRCSLINKQGTCYQCAELNDYFQSVKDSGEKVAKLGISKNNNSKDNLKQRFSIISKINPLNSNGSALEDTIMQILRFSIGEDNKIISN